MSEQTPVYSITKAPGEIKFMGYGNPKYTGIPDLFLDEQMQDLTEAELKVMLYIFRRTYGFKKEQDAISYDQFLNGITRQDGKQLDRGTGISRESLRTALNKLVERGYIFKHNRFGTNGANRTTIYELNIDGVPHFDPTNPSLNFSPSPSLNFIPTLDQNLAPHSRLNPSLNFSPTRKQLNKKQKEVSPLLTTNSEELEPRPVVETEEDDIAFLRQYAREHNQI